MDAFRKELIELLQSEDIPDPVMRLHVMKILGPPFPKAKISYDEFLDWLDEDTLAEWVDGEVIMASPASKKHQDIGGFLYQIISSYANFKNLGEVMQPPFQMKLKHSGREPDLLFVKKEHLHRFKKTYLDGPADLVVEIISPESAGRDRGDKYFEYEQAGIPEYWLIDPQRKEVDFYGLSKSKKYEIAPLDDAGKFYSVALPKFWIKPDWLWLEPLPSPLRILAEIAGVKKSILQKFENALKND